MKKVNANVRVTELDTVSDVIVRLYKADAAVASDGYLKEVMGEIENLSEKITAAIKQDKSASMLDAADTERDEIIRSLGTLLNGYAVIPVPDKKAAAEKLLAVFNKYKKITNVSYANESSLIESMIADFSASALTDAITVLEGVSVYLTDLRTAQNKFNKANDEFTSAKTNKGASATSLKKRLLGAINDKLVPYVTAMTLANGKIYNSFSSKADTEIEKLNGSLSKRKKSAS